MRRPSKIKVIAVVGARPNFIKLAALYRQFKKSSFFKENVDFCLIHTGQHYDFEMSDIFFRQLPILKPDYNLKVGSKDHASQTAEIMIKLEDIFMREKPDLTILFGDVNSSLAAALTSAKMNVPIAHIEAGLRSFDKKMPEEINRIVVDALSDYNFCPTKTSFMNLKKEGKGKSAYYVGDVMYDLFLKNYKDAEKSKILKTIGINVKDYLLLTLHRASNTDSLSNLKTILSALSKSGTHVVFPIHPRTDKKLKKISFKKPKNFTIISPVGYLDMIALEKNASKIITDSGGVQKEAFWLKIPCITLRENTEWPETLSGKWNIITGADKNKIKNALKAARPRQDLGKYFGNGDAAFKITDAIINNFK